MSGRPSPSIDQHQIGRRLRQARELAGISLRQLAKRVDLSASAVSQIETGATQPSVKTLYALAVELGLSLDDLLDNPFLEWRGRIGSSNSSLLPTSDDDRVLRKRDRAILELDTGVRWERLTTRSDPLLDFLQITYEPGSAVSAHGRLTRSEGVELGVILSGHLDLTMGFETHRLGPGDSISLKWAEPHLLANNESEPASCVWVILPDGFDQISLRRLRSFVRAPGRATPSEQDTVDLSAGASRVSAPAG
jgi:transcriptional regulator with XRE-family HTH domain